MVNVNVRFFANLKDLVGTNSMNFEIEENVTIKDFTLILLAKVPALKDIMEKRRLFISLNQEMAQNEDIINDGDEIALLPPFSGG